MRLLQILLHNRFYIARRNTMQIKDIRDRNADRFIL